MQAAENTYDVVIIGGAFSGASTAIMLQRSVPGIRVLVVERSEAFDRKVGEATVEVSAYFLHRVLGLFDVLSREHLPKHGLRYWFSDGPGRTLGQMSEVGPLGPPSLATFQVDRSRLDERLIGLAADAGAEIVRPAQIATVDLEWPENQVSIEHDGIARVVTARWVIDASGRHAVLARRLRLRERTERHPTAAVWARFTGVADLDGPEILGDDVRAPRLPSLLASRRLATNHFCGYGWWCWLIPLPGGETSVGLVYDKELFEWPSEGPLGERFEAFVRGQPGLSELLENAALEEGDLHSYRHLPYRTSRYMDHGWAIVGDAAGFIDPFYSPGLDHASISIYSTVRIVERDLRGELDEARLVAMIDEHDRSFVRSYDRWLDALYIGKYEVMGDAELLAAAFLLDTGFYYLGVVAPVYRDLESLRYPLFGAFLPQAELAYRVVRFYNRRLLGLARFRRASGTYGRRNVGWRRLDRFSLGIGGFRLVLTGLALWMRAELHRLFFIARHPSFAWRARPERPAGTPEAMPPSEASREV